jgi:hypothetical protein
MKNIQHFLPNPRHCEIHRIFVDAKPEDAWEAARYFDMSEVKWIRLLFEIRTLPQSLSGNETDDMRQGLGVDDITNSNSGFIMLQERAGREVVVGSVGKFWQLRIPFESVSPAEFVNFEEPGFGKIAWGIAVEPFRYGSTIAIELRISATDEWSWKKLNRYYKVIGIGSRWIRSAVTSQLEAQLGKMTLPDDDLRNLPGDDLIPDAKYQITYHRNIEAPVSIVWRYLMQLGCDRAGWYSIDLLDHDGQISTDHLVDGWETRAVGDKFAATLKDDDFFNVYSLDHEKHFVIGGNTQRGGGPFKMSWAFIVEPIGEDATHLITRARMESSPKWAEYLMGKMAYPPIHGLMSRVQLDTIKRLAERDAQLGNFISVHTG